MPKVVLTEDAVALLESYRWPGNIRQLKNVTETVSALESRNVSGRSDKCEVDAATLRKYIPKDGPNMLPVKASPSDESSFSPSEKEMLVRSIYQLKQDVDYLKSVISSAQGFGGQIGETASGPKPHDPQVDFSTVWGKSVNIDKMPAEPLMKPREEEPEEQDGGTLSLEKSETELIRKALEKYDGNRKLAAEELGISERTLYRKLKSFEKDEK